MGLAEKLMSRLDNKQAKPLLAPGVFDGLSAIMAANAGAEALYLSGASFAYSRFGRPDIGLVCMSEMADNIAAISDRVTMPLIVDADTGFGNALNVVRTARVFSRAGAAAIQLEDQTLPKRCGHLGGKSLVSSQEMVGKIKAAKDALDEKVCVVIARTDALAIEGTSAALDRAETYLEAGADILFIEAPQNIETIQSIARCFSGRVPLLINMIEGGKTPLLSLEELKQLGFSLVIYPGAFVRALSFMGTEFYKDLLTSGSTVSWHKRMLDLSGLNDLLGTSHMLEMGKKYDQSGKF